MSATPREIVLGFFAELRAGDLDAAFSRIADDASWELIAGASGYPYPTRHTKASYRQLILDSARTFPQGIELIITGVTAEDERVALEAESHGRTAGGRAYDNRYHFLFEVRGGRIRAVREYLDSGYAAQVLGAEAAAAQNSSSSRP